MGESFYNPPFYLLLQPLRINSHPGPRKRCLFVCRHGERMDVVFGKYWLSQCFDAKGRYIRTNLNMPPSLPQRSGGCRDYEKDAPHNRLRMHTSKTCW
ncbi:unnamed protein product [Ranitomeya imitator]|uniref:Uncharacterized protein n=1 Tax=Ranitomeya imitator TaxID=111125 RepID=A0ABN9M132_9NEOB|nr:unnamed protein product [Ranitomeya imitator]